MKAAIRRVLSRLGYEVRGTRFTPRQLLDSANLRPVELGDLLCRRMVETRKDLTFIQVGAYDGTTCDPLQAYIETFAWRGVMVEPQARAAEQLRTLYRANPSITVLQAAIESAPGDAVLYTVETDEGLAWAGGLASFDRDCIIKHSNLIPGLDELIRTEVVACVTFDDVLARLPEGSIDLLQIDTEGADAHILSLFPLERIRPAIIHWEVKHLTKADREACLARLATYGYRFAPSGQEDMLAVLF